MTHQLEKILDNVNGASFISIDTETIPTLRGGKKNPMQGLVRKVMIGAVVMVFTNKRSNAYENMVERRLIEEGKDPTGFELQPRKWGVRRVESPFIDHNDQLYLEVIFLRPGQVYYFFNDQPISKEDIEGLDNDKAEGEQGGLDNKVIIRTFNVDSIKAITINKQRTEL